MRSLTLSTVFQLTQYVREHWEQNLITVQYFPYLNYHDIYKMPSIALLNNLNGQLQKLT